MLVQLSTTFPRTIRKSVIPFAVTWLPVGGIPNQSPRWVPPTLQRNATISPSAKISSSAAFRSGKAVRYEAISCFRPSVPGGSVEGRGCST
jgi:hypothetical protein